MGYSRWISNYLKKKIALSDLAYMISTVNYVVINMETRRIDSGCSLEKEFTKVICMNL